MVIQNLVTLPMVFCNTKTPYTLVRYSDDFCLIFTLQDFVRGMTNLTIDTGLKLILLYTLLYLINLTLHTVSKES